ncbi:MAG: preprotein translocase subunit SecG [Crocinitomicaceae bacterium]|nr:preprotein translocase subunit SecG [Crocinitomicaceae bacterium]|tara:strand:+ start:1938 stop:2273 length:336 start_codon:yes stop_codon:yes gene_type:complete
MEFLDTFLIVVILIISFLLGAVILVQNPKGGGLAAGFTGGAQMGGVQRTTDFLEKSTWYLVVALFVTCIIAGMQKNTKTDTGVNPLDMRNTQIELNENLSTSDSAPVEVIE